MLQTLTRKEKLVLEYIENYFQHEGLAPSYSEIKNFFGLASFNSVQKYLKQLQKKEYIFIPGGNQKRAIQLLKSANSVEKHLRYLQDQQSYNPFIQPPNHQETPEKALYTSGPTPESLSIPLFGRVAAGKPLEAIEHNEFFEVPSSLVKSADKTFALRVEGDSMIEDGIHNGDVIVVEDKSTALNGEIVVATVDNEATLKRFFVHKDKPQQVELRPANSRMKPMWFSLSDIHIRGIVVGLIRKF